MINIKFIPLLLVSALSACSNYYTDEVKAPTEQELADARDTIVPSGALRTGVFHMQEVQDGSNVLVKENIELKRPDLPPFDVAYISRDVESILLELANAAGESIIIPQGLRGRTVTLVHSGADFQEMLDLVLAKAGYHYNYIDGVWHITRYPIRNYLLEISQSSRKGGLISTAEVGPENDGNSNTSGATDLETTYSDQVWIQIREALNDLVKVGDSNLAKNANLSAQGVTGTGQIITDAQALQQDVNLLPPPELENNPEKEEELFGALTHTKGVRPLQISNPQSNDHLAPEEDASPWVKITEGAGMITVRAAPEAHRQIQIYLEQVQDSILRQITVETRIVALIRDKTSKRGGGLNSIFDATDDLSGRLGFNAQTPVSFDSPVGGFITLTSRKNDLSFVMQSLSQLGDVYTISSPKILARNNQISRVSVTRQLGYVETQVETNTTSGGEVKIGSRTDTARFKNAGTVMSVMPFIGKSKVQMRFRLSVATQSGNTEIRTSIGTDDPVVNQVPELANNVIDQDMVMEFGRVYAIGGLLETSTTLDESYEPLFQQVPGMRDVMRHANNRKQDTEFIVLMKVSRG